MTKTVQHLHLPRTDAAVWSEQASSSCLPLADSTASDHSTQLSHVKRNTNNNVIELNDLASLCQMAGSNHSSIASSMISLDDEMNIRASTKTLNSCPFPTMEIDNELINILTLNNHRAGKTQNKPKNHMKLSPAGQMKIVEEQVTCDKSALLGKMKFSMVE